MSSVNNFCISSNKNIIKASVFVAFAVLGLAFAPNVNGEENQTAQESVHSPVNYQFEVVENENLTLLVRRSLQLYDERDSGVSMSPAQMVYAETNVVSQLGAKDLAIGQTVEIPTELIAQFAKNSQSLNESQIANWTKYASRVNFDLSNVKPANVPQPEKDIEQETSESTADSNQEQAPASEESKDSNWNWFAILGLVFVAFWLWIRRQQTPKV